MGLEVRSEFVPCHPPPSVVGHLSLYAVLVVTLRQVGVSDDEVGWAEILAVFAFARLLTAIPLTPGGLGIVEVALISGLTAAGGADAQVVASVLVFRVLTYVIPIPFGLCTYVYWRRNKSWLDSAPPLDPRFTAESVEEYVPGSAAATSARRKTLAMRAAERRMAPWTRDATPGLRPHRTGGPRPVRTGCPQRRGRRGRATRVPLDQRLAGVDLPPDVVVPAGRQPHRRVRWSCSSSRSCCAGRSSPSRPSPLSASSSR